MIRRISCAVLAGLTVASATAQQEQHGRKFKPLPPTAHVVVLVEKGFNSKPLENAAVIFHATLDGKSDANLEVKTDPDGKATIDLLEVGSHVTVQVLASGFATYATDFDVTSAEKELTVKLIRPQQQVSTYQNNDGKTAHVTPGIQEHIVSKPTAPTAPAPGTPAATSPATTAPATPATPAMPPEIPAPAATSTSPVAPPK